jgi:hypothetical protein
VPVIVKKIFTSGLIAAVTFILLSMLWSRLGGGGLWRPLNLVAHAFWPQAPTGGGFTARPALLAAVVITAIAVAVMAPFVVVGLGVDLGAASLTIGAAVYAGTAWVFGHNLIWEAIDPIAAQKFSPGVAWLAHLAAGLAAGAALARKPRPRRAPARHRLHKTRYRLGKNGRVRAQRV